MTLKNDIKSMLNCYGAPAPRYTSYPSAAHFENDFQPTQVADALSAQPEGRGVSLYIHIPFCRQLCQYCGCFTRVVRDDAPVQDYLSLLEKEITLAGELSGRRLSAAHIHFGGGSPNLLTGDDVGRILGRIDFNFNIQANTTIALEADPRQMTFAKAQAYARGGVNRISLGVQDFNEQTQKAINRIQPFAMVSECVSGLREVGIRAINFDLMYGLPHQTADTVAENAFKASALGVDRVSLFGYAHVPWMRTHQKKLEKFGLPDAAQRYEQEQAARDIFLEEGYAAIGMDHFALPTDAMAVAAREGRLHRNFQGYTVDSQPLLLGFGLSSISRFPEMYAQNTSSAKLYAERLEQGLLPVEKGRFLSGEDRLRAAIIEQLMCHFTADAGAVCEAQGFATDFLDSSLRGLAPMTRDGLVRVEGRSVQVREPGRYFVRSVCAAFDGVLQREPGKSYARAV